jgi:hypothetical protein
MDDAKPSLTKRALAAVVLVVVAIVALRAVLGFISAIFWLVAIVALLIAGVWAVSTLKAGGRERRVKRSSATPVAPPSQEDRVDAQLRQLREQLRDQGRL